MNDSTTSPPRTISGQGWLSKSLDGLFEQRQFSAGLAVRMLGTLFVAYMAGQVIYNLYFHPLAKYPGPFWARASLLWRLRHSMGGRFHLVIENSHKRYGDVFRVSPNELSFCTVGAWKAIYTPREGRGVAKIPKNEFYEMFGSGFDIPSLGTETDPVLASKKRDHFATALSARGLAQQEPIIQRNVDAWLAKLGKLGTEDEGVDMSRWFLYLAFDILGEMAFGQSFGCVENESSHYWLDLMLGHLLVITLMDNVRRYPFTLTLARLVPSKWTVGIRDSITRYSHDMARNLLEREGEQYQQEQDFMANAVSMVKKGAMSEEELASHASNIAMAGGETSGSSMAAITYYLLTTPDAYKKLNEEVRTNYRSLDDITVASTTQLPYLMAVLKEGMRIFPTAPQGTPRKSPGWTVEGHYVPPGSEFYVSPWAISHDERYFHEPNTFKPDRWVDPGCTDNRDASQPFSVGPRACPGKLFAYGQMCVQLAKMCYMYDMELVNPDLDWEKECKMHFLWWKPALRVRFRLRSDL